MMKSEFQELLTSKKEKLGCFDPGRQISNKEYELIEFIYNYYPSNFDKEDVVGLYIDFGIILFEDMLPRAKRAMELEIEDAAWNNNYSETIKKMEAEHMEITKSLTSLKFGMEGPYNYEI